MDIRYKIYGKTPEYCIVVGHRGRVLQEYRGTFSRVNFNWRSLFELIMVDQVSYVLHSHPFGAGPIFSHLDQQVFESWGVATGRSLEHRIIDFKRLNCYLVSETGNIYQVDRRPIGVLESLTSWPWGVRL